jgi:hypothetical protein
MTARQQTDCPWGAVLIVLNSVAIGRSAVTVSEHVHSTRCQKFFLVPGYTNSVPVAVSSHRLPNPRDSASLLLRAEGLGPDELQTLEDVEY